MNIFASRIFRSDRRFSSIIFVIVIVLTVTSIGFTTWNAHHNDEQKVEPAGNNWAPLTMLPTDAWYSWSFRDTKTGKIKESSNAKTEQNNTESMIKIWIGADYLNGIKEADREPDENELQLLHNMIHVSDDNAAEVLYQSRGADAVIERLITGAKLTHTTTHSGWWALTQITARDATTMLKYVLKLARDNPWIAWLLDEARHVDPSNAFGIPAALPPGTSTAVKNGWTANGENWNLNCLAAWDTKILAVLTRYPVELGQQYGADICADITEQVTRRNS